MQRWKATASPAAIIRLAAGAIQTASVLSVRCVSPLEATLAINEVNAVRAANKKAEGQVRDSATFFIILRFDGHAARDCPKQLFDRSRL